MQTRNTKQKSAIKNAFETANRPLSPEEVLELSKSEARGISLATVYRNIKALLDDGYLQTVELVNEAPRYETSNRGHHHHFRCNSCNKVYDLDGCVSNVDKLVPRGFRVEMHHLLFYGECKSCCQ